MTGKGKIGLSVSVVASVLLVAAAYFYLWHLAPLSLDQRTGVSTAIATGVLGIVAAIALGANIYQARQTRRAVDAASTEAKAVEAQTKTLLRQAKASETLAEEAQRSRDLEWQPLLRWEGPMPDALLYGPVERGLRNEGRGPAFRAAFAWRSGDKLLVSPEASIGSSGIRDVIKWSSSPADTRMLPTDANWAAVCEDHFGNRYRFLDSGARPDIWSYTKSKHFRSWFRIWGLAGLAKAADIGINTEEG